MYALFGAENAVEHYFQIAPHQYNRNTRRRVYSFFARHLMGKELCWEEETIDTPYLADMVWFKEGEKAPGFADDEAYFAVHKAELTARVAALPKAEKKRMLAWVAGIDGRDFTVADGMLGQDHGITVERNVLTSPRGEQIPWVKLTPAGWDGKRLCLVLGEQGKSCLTSPAVQDLLDNGTAVLSGDLFLTGEYADANHTVLGPYNATRYFTTFHYTAAAYRTQDVSLLWRLASSLAEDTTLYATGAAARAAACALPLLNRVKAAQLDGSALRLSTDRDYMDGFFLPCLLPLGGLQGCLEMADCPVELV